MELCALAQQIPFHQKLRQHLMMKAMGLTRPAQQLEILYIMPMLGNANVTAVGMTPLAHLAICNVCSDSGCLDSDILAAMDAAVEDGMVQRNEGSYNGSLSNEAPRILTVGASTIDGSIRADVLWEIPSLFFGESLFQPNSPPYMSLVYTGSHGSDQQHFVHRNHCPI
ncbi:PROPROTEIN CONVERTASE SUBTILISIN/KEXIN [Salix koriyanagi]|uniref:PROPROTEIN CONVERTASE SUBTILISIN/KEXIN n=1 Tax=Salix koriyanagi TaxID=2511006 RepID=A0A9Q0Q871_9ROSI|nr:PROPROTEIN CONVERTASE SUBTILISIN/KEXIN [Salix koriyanagi]